MFSDNLICTPHGTSLAQMFCFNKEIVNISFLDHNDNKNYLNVFSKILSQLFACIQITHWYIEQTNTFAIGQVYQIQNLLHM